MVRLMKQKPHLPLFIWFFLCPVYIYSKTGYVSEVVLNSKFHCDSSQMDVHKTSSEIQCVHKCARSTNCQLLNYRMDAGPGNCEIFRLPHDHKSCRMLKDETNWKALVYEIQCHAMEYNHCFPCKCKSTCLPKETNCQCDSVSSLPDILISFEELLSSTIVDYTRGTDKDGNSRLILKSGATTGVTKGRFGNVLRLNGINAGAVVGDFRKHPLNNPNEGKSTVTFWIKVLTAQPTPQNIYGSGLKNDNSGFLLQLVNYASQIRIYIMAQFSDMTLEYFVGETLKSWTHIALVEYAGSGPSMKLYVNGVLVQTGKETSGKNSNDARFTKVILGADNDLSPLINDHYHVHIDDFAVWLTDLPEAEIAYIMKQDFTSCMN